MIRNSQTLAGWKIIKAADLGEYDAETCELCSRALRYLIITRDPSGKLRGLGAECASKVTNIASGALERLQRCLFKEENRVPVTRTQLPSGFLIPPVPALNGYPIVPVVQSLRFSLMPEITPQPFHVCASGYWCRCIEDGCSECAQHSPIRASLYGVCVWKLSERGTLCMPLNWPYGCSSFRGLALRDCDISVMRSLRENIFAYDWQINRDRSSEKTVGDNVQLVGGSSLRLSGDYVSILAMEHTETVNGVTRWNELIMPSGPTQAELDREAAELERVLEDMEGLE